MKTERRHELQTNQLADSLGHWLESIRPYGRTIAGVGVAALLLIAVMAYVSNENQKKLAVGWTDFSKAFNDAAMAVGTRNFTQINDEVAKLDQFKSDYPGTPLDFWSRMCAADFRMEAGASELFRDKAEARGMINDALEDYSYVAKNAREPQLLQRAYYGMGRAHESLGDLKDAAEDYKTVLQRWKDGPYAAMAHKRVDDLETQQTKEFYDWFAQYQPPKQPAPGERPIFDHDSLMSPGGGASNSSDIKLPSVVDLLDSGASATPPAGTNTTPSTPELPLPSVTDTPAKTETPAPAATPETKPETKTEAPAPEKKSETPAPETKSETKTETPAPEAKKEEAPKEPELKLPEAK